DIPRDARRECTGAARPVQTPAAAARSGPRSRGGSMHRTCNTADKPLSSPGSTGWVERLAPDDPLLDAEEIEIPHAERIRRSPRARAAAARAAAAVALALEACGGASAPSLQASDSVLVQLERDADAP